MALVLGLFAALCWSGHDLIARKLADTMGAYRMAFRTMIVGFFMLLPFAFYIGHARVRDWLALLVLGVIYGIGVSSLFKAFALAPVSIVAPLTAGYPALVVVWGLITGLSPNLLQATAIVIALVGAVVVGRTSPKDGGTNAVAQGKLRVVMLTSILASGCFAAAVVVGQNLSPVFGEAGTAGLLRLPAAMVLLPMVFNERAVATEWTRSSVLAVVAMAGLDVAALTGINFMARLPNKEFGAMGISAYGGIAALLAMVVLKEKVSRGQWVGIAMIVGGVAMLGI